MMHLPYGRTARLQLFALFLIAAAWFGTLAARDLAKTDEGRYAEIPREMVASGDWLTPRLDDFKYFEKPALQYWATAVAFDLFGETPFAARVWTGLCGLLGVLLVGFTASRVYGVPCGRAAAGFLAGSLLYLLMGHINTLDMGLTFFMTLTLCALMLARRAQSAPVQRRWMLVCWAAMALAMLSKGLIGIVLPCAVAVIYLAATRDWRLLRRIEPVRGPVLFLLIGAPWFIAVSLANPGFFHFFFIHEHFERFLTTSHHREGPLWYFVPILVLGMLPWAFMLANALWRAAMADRALPDGDGPPFHADRLLLIWVVFIFVFFSVSSSKLPSYILPIFPALAILLGRAWTEFTSRQQRWHVLAICLLASVGAVVALNAEAFAHAPGESEAYARFGGWIFVACCLWFAGGLGAFLTLRRGDDERVTLILFGSAVCAGLVALCGYAELDRFASARYVAEVMRPLVTPATRLYSVEMYEQTLPFYLKRTFTPVNYQDELAFGEQAEPGHWIPRIDAFVVDWSAAPDALAIMPPDTYQHLKATNIPARVILSDHRFVVLAKP